MQAPLLLLMLVLLLLINVVAFEHTQLLVGLACTDGCMHMHAHTCTHARNNNLSLCTTALQEERGWQELPELHAQPARALVLVRWSELFLST